MNVFLSAEWRRLLNLTYAIPPEKLQPLIPNQLELDIIEGDAFISLVAFDFLNTKVKGVKIPFHINFPEINLRFYVKHKGKRGVMFIKEYVPKHCIAYIANKFYNEPYVSFPMESKTSELPEGGLKITHQVWKEKDIHSISFSVGKDSYIPGEDTPEHYFKEHDLGFGIDKKGELLSYFVEHPVWSVRNITGLKLDFDFEKMYGPEWAFLGDIEPKYKLFADGSEIKVYSKLSEEGLDSALSENENKGQAAES